MLRLTAQYGDGWIPAWWLSPKEYGEKLSIITEHANSFGRPVPEASYLAFILFCEWLTFAPKQNIDFCCSICH